MPLPACYTNWCHSEAGVGEALHRWQPVIASGPLDHSSSNVMQRSMAEPRQSAVNSAKNINYNITHVDGQLMMDDCLNSSIII